jgi:hypothetical protein
MAQSKVPADPNLSPEMRRFLDDLTKVGGQLQEQIDDALGTLPEFANQAEAEAGTADDKWMSPEGTAQAIAAQAPFSNNFVHVRDEKAQGNDGGTFNSGSWVTRTLNAVKTNTVSGASLSSNEITLPAGRYFIDAGSPAFAVAANQARLFDVTGSAVLITGTTERNVTTNGAMTRSEIRGEFTLSVTSAVRVEHRCSSTQSTTGFGSAANLTTEVYTEVLIWKLN